MLVVDDEAMVLSVARRTLERAGLRVLVAPGGREALTLLDMDRAGVGVVILDLTMPGFSGEQTLEELHRRWPDLPVVISTGYAGAGSSDRFRRLGVVGTVEKPYMPQDLVTAARQAMGEA